VRIKCVTAEQPPFRRHVVSEGLERCSRLATLFLGDLNIIKKKDVGGNENNTQSTFREVDVFARV
jgi:hypothetical protein